MNKNILVFLVAGALLTVGAITSIVPAAYAGGDDDGNKNKAEDESAAAIADCDKNDVERAGFDCFGIAVNDIELELGGGEEMVTAVPGLGATEETDTEEQ
jgi:hypothetical protein